MTYTREVVPILDRLKAAAIRGEPLDPEDVQAAADALDARDAGTDPDFASLFSAMMAVVPSRPPRIVVVADIYIDGHKATMEFSNGEAGYLESVTK